MTGDRNMDALRNMRLRPDRPLRASDLRDVMKRGRADLAHLLISRDIHARRRAAAEPKAPAGKQREADQ